MIDDLLHIYEESRLNRGQPESLFNPTLIFNEGWLLRAVLRQWKWADKPAPLPALPCRAKVTRRPMYSPFAPRQRDKLKRIPTWMVSSATSRSAQPNLELR